MIPSDLLGSFAQHFADTAIESQYKFRADESKQVFGGYNVMMLGDTLQLPPIPSSAALFNRYREFRQARDMRFALYVICYQMCIFGKVDAILA